MDIMLILNKMLVMLIMLGTGVVAAKTGIVDPEGNRGLSRLAMDVSQTAAILASAVNVQMEITVGKVFGILGAGCAMYAVLVVVGLLVPRLTRAKASDRGIYSFLTIFGNVAFMGFPMVGAIFGDGAVFYAVLLCVPFNLLAFTLGVKLISGHSQFCWRDLMTPTLAASVAAVILIFLPVTWPQPLTEALGYMGDMILPLSMIIIGASLGEQKLKDVFLDWRVYLFCPVRLILSPVVVWGVMRLFIHDTLLLNVMTVVAAMPAAAVAAMMSIQYGANERLASRVVFLSTVLSAGTIPLVCWLLL